MKKWLFILVICFLFMPNDVFASTYATPTFKSVSSSTSINDGLTTRSPVTTFHYGRSFIGHNVSPSARTRIIFDYSNLDLDTSKAYDYDFLIFYTSLTGEEGSVPLVTMENQMCEVKSVGYYGGGYSANSNSSITFPGGSSTDPFMWYRYDPISSGQLGIWFNGNKTINYNTQFEIIRNVDTSYTFGVSCSNVTITDLSNVRFDIYGATHESLRNPPEYSISGNVTFDLNQASEIKESIGDLNDSITDSDISGASDSAGGFFTDFENDDYGLSDIVTLPLTFIQGLANASCTDLELPLPFVDEDVELPCMSAIYEDYFGAFLTIYQIITFGIVGYWVCVNTLRLVNNFKNPDNDEVEVMDL